MNRQERRRKTKSARIAGATSTPAPFGADDALNAMLGRYRPTGKPQAPQPMAKGFVFDMTGAETAAALDGRRDLPGLVQAVAAAYFFSEGVWAGARKARAKGKPIACAKGCNWCCHQQVSLSSYEAAVIVDRVRRTWPAGRIAALGARLKDRIARTEGQDADAVRRARLPCAFLEDGACSIHEVRPFRCRAYNSTDADVCRWIVEHAEEAEAKRKANALPLVFDGEAPQIFDDAQHAMAEALARGGFAYDHLELTRAALIGLDAPDLIARWIGGADAFAPARIGDKPG